MNNKYTKITYESSPIGADKIILYLTTFDLESFESDKNLEKIPIKKKAIAFDFNKHDLTNNYDLLEQMNNTIEAIVRNEYQKQLEEMKSYIECNRKIPKVQYFNIDDKIKFNILGEEKDFYVSHIEKENIYGSCNRMKRGELTQNKIDEKLKIQMIEM